jgi:transposase
MVEVSTLLTTIFLKEREPQMSTAHYIAFDVHCKTTEMAVVTSAGRITKRDRCSTTIPELVELISSVRRPRRLTFEEGSMAGWLKRNLERYVEELIVCEPRRNSLIAKDNDKDDPIDAGKLAQLFRGGYLKPVHHPESLDRTVFKQHITLYHNAVRERVRMANRIIAQFRHHGVMVTETNYSNEEDRDELLQRLPPSKLLRFDIEWLWDTYDAMVDRETASRSELVRRAERIEPIGRFVELPGISWIRAATFYAYLDTPWRFQGKSSLWKYMGIGLDRQHSGQGRGRVRVTKHGNRRLKSMIMGAAITAIAMRNNPFFNQYEHWFVKGGLSPQNARRNVARSMTATLWGMWKNSTAYDPTRVGRAC